MTERPQLLLSETTEPGAMRERSIGIDPLSDVLDTVRLTGAVFFAIDASSPWGAGVPDGAALVPALLPSAQRVISYHVLTEGRCFGALAGEAPIALEAGDILVLPQGDAYWMALAPEQPRSDRAGEVEFLRKAARGELPFCVRDGGGGAQRVGLLCGFLGCDLLPFNPLLANLPKILRVPSAAAGQDPRLAQLIAFAAAEASDPRAGSASVRLRVSELLFVEVVRRHLAALPPEQASWLGGLRDPCVGQALALLHGRVAHAWSLVELAEAAGVSRSVLAERFAHFVGQPPLQYLSRWRMQVAATRLASGQEKVAAVALAVGYESEAAFSRAFKKATGVSPSHWRSRRTPQRQRHARDHSA